MGGMPSLAAACDAVINAGWLAQTPEWFRQAVLSRCTRKIYGAGETVYSIGDPPGGMYGIVSGSLAVFIAPHENGPLLIHVARPGSWFGEGPALTGQPRAIGLKATRETVLLHLPLPAIYEITTADPGAWKFFTLVPLAHARNLVGALDDMMIRNPTKRVIAILLRLGGCRIVTEPNIRGPIEIDTSQEDLARIANLARTTVGPILRELESLGLIEVQYRCVHLDAPDRLRAMLCESD